MTMSKAGEEMIILAKEEEEWEGLCNILENLILDPDSQPPISSSQFSSLLFHHYL